MMKTQIGNRNEQRWLGWVSGRVRLREIRSKPVITGSFARYSAEIVSVNLLRATISDDRVGCPKQRMGVGIYRFAGVDEPWTVDQPSMA